MKKGSSEPSPLDKARHIETVEVGFSWSSAVVEFTHSLFRPLPRAVAAGCSDALFPLHAETA